MSKRIKFLIGLALALLAGWVSHGPLGQGEAFAAQLDEQVNAVLAPINLAGVSGHVQRDPIARVVIMSGPADCFQRGGLGSYPGIDDRMLEIPGVRSVIWTNPAPEGECR